MSRKRSILIVEDEIIIAKDLERILLNEGYNVLGIISSGEEAIKQAIELQPDLVLLDITLSDNISGIDVASVIQFHQIPVIYITAFSDKRNIKGIIDSGSYGYVLKPYNNEELITTIEIALSRHKTYKKIKESENRYRTLFANMQNGLAYHKIITHEDGTPIDCIFLDINDSFEWLTGLKRENIIGKRVTEVLPGIENDPSGWIEKYGKVALTGKSTRFESFSTNFKKWFYVNAYSPQKGYFATIFEDITERKQAEENLRKEKRFSDNIITTIPDSLLVIDKNLKIKSANHTFYETFHIKPEKVIGASIIHVLRNEGGILSTELTKLFGTDDMLENFELHYQLEKLGLPRESNLRTSQGERIFNITARGIIIAEEEEEEEELIILQDITEQKISEEKLKNAFTELDKTQQELIQSQTLAALGEFSAGLAHEIRNPLANISALAQFSIKNYTIDKPIKQNLKSIMKSSEKANRIIKELLDFARPRELILKPGYIIDSINQACELTKGRRSNNQIRLYKRCSRRLPKIMIDEQRMQQVFLNIINNSLDAMNKGGRLSITAYLKDEFIVVNISDTGKGIQKRNVDKIFNPFFTLKHEGIGLGLSVTHRIIQSHKGKIEVESEFNKGTKFIIRLPVVNDKK